MCPFCGYPDREGCQAAFDRLAAWTLTQPRPPFIHQLAVHAYAAQHVTLPISRIGDLLALMSLYMVSEQVETGLEIQMDH